MFRGHCNGINSIANGISLDSGFIIGKYVWPPEVLVAACRLMGGLCQGSFYLKTLLKCFVNGTKISLERRVKETPEGESTAWS